MKKYLLMGLAIIIGTNLVVLSGVAFNRSEEATSSLILTERELSLPYNIQSQKENSGLSLSINWRTPSQDDKPFYYNSNQMFISKNALLALGFEQIETQHSNRSEPLEIYWALEFDGALHRAEITKTAAKYQQLLLAYEELDNNENKLKKEQYNDLLIREKVSNSRLFFVEAAADYKTLASTFSGQKNILIVKGLANYSYNSENETYNLHLKELSVGNIMVPLEYMDVFSGLSRGNRKSTEPPRYTVNVKWGTRLEPWVVDTKRLQD